LFKIVVQKFGGTSVQDAEAMNRAMVIVRDTAINKKYRPLVVLSAAAGVTNALIKISELAVRGEVEAALNDIELLSVRHETMARELIDGKKLLGQTIAKLNDIWQHLRTLVRGVHLLGELTPKSRDQFQAMGELCSTTVFAAAFSERLKPKEIKVQFLDAREFFVTSEDHTLARPLLPEIEKKITKAKASISKGTVCVTQGFIGKTKEGVTTTIGRGGGDFSAAIMGVAIQAEEIQIWTDVAGVFTCDPRIAPAAHALESISFNEASQLTYFGAKVLHPETIWPAVQKRIPVRVLSSKEPKLPGTTILFESVESEGLTGIALKRNIVLIKVVSLSPLPNSQPQQAVWDALSMSGIVPLAVSLSADSALYAFDDMRPITAMRQAVEGVAELHIASDRALISLVGSGLKSSSGIAAKIFKAVGGCNCEMISYGGSDTTINFVVHNSDAELVTKRLHRTFFE